MSTTYQIDFKESLTSSEIQFYKEHTLQRLRTLFKKNEVNCEELSRIQKLCELVNYPVLSKLVFNLHEIVKNDLPECTVEEAQIRVLERIEFLSA